MELFKSRKYLLELGVVHTLISLLLYYFSQYFFLMFLQIIFFVVIFEYKTNFVNRFSLFLYLIALNYSLILFFSFTAYFVYFVCLFSIIVFIYKQNIMFTKKDFLAYGLFAAFVAGLFRYFEDDIFDLYIYMNIVDAQNYYSIGVAAILSIMHLFILLFILSKKTI